MGTVRLVPPATPVEVAPGARADWRLGVVNDGEARRLRLSATGTAGAWLSLPLDLWLGPGEEREVVLTVSPAAGAGPLGAVVSMVVDAADASGVGASTAAVIVLGAQERVEVTLEAPSAPFLRHTTVAVLVHGRGTSDAQVGLEVEPRPSCSLPTSRVGVEPGRTVRAEVLVRPQLLWRGPPRSTTVAVSWRAGSSRGEATATVRQRPVLAARASSAVALALVLGVLAAVLASRVLG